MNTSQSFNVDTVDWRNPECKITSAPVADYAASDGDIAAYQRDGVVLLRGLFDDWVDRLRAGLTRNLEAPERYAFPCESNPSGQPGRFFDSYCNWQLIPEYFDYVTQSCAASVAGQFMGGDSARFFHEHAFLKAPGTQRATPWHQDLPYYCVDGYQTASIYVSLDHADAEVAVQFVRGSHRWGQLYYPRVFENGSDFNDDLPDNPMAPVPDIDSEPQAYDIAAWSLQPGDTIVFDFRTLHGTGDAEVRSMRRAFSTRWLGKDVTYCDRPGETSPPYRDHGMRHGEPLRDDWFPLLWRRPAPG